ncbi:hypothetical protein [Halomonas sp. PAR8]|uniref:hypothetical protein n=1 Tax=Halomonas sp. PAR8 TaxID=3075515 RepID=UPI002888D3EA|nr:hypothetical protein [Halomonas sp. PAR8]MDT0593215.1 hypothetical protein [Halomonas sp. PAR8]
MVFAVFDTLAVGFFSTSSGFIYGHGLTQLGVQTLGVIVITCWTTACLGALLFAIKQITSLRVSKEEEIAGLDFTDHGSNAYAFKENFLASDENSTTSTLGLAAKLNRLTKTKEIS